MRFGACGRAAAASSPPRRAGGATPMPSTGEAAWRCSSPPRRRSSSMPRDGSAMSNSLFDDEPSPPAARPTKPGDGSARPPVLEGTPLAERVRPQTLDDVVGQEHILAPGTPLREAIERDVLQSIIFWGPPGTGKTTLARIIAEMTEAQFIQ